MAALVLDCMLIYANYGYPQATAGEETAQIHLSGPAKSSAPPGNFMGNRGAGCGPV